MAKAYSKKWTSSKARYGKKKKAVTRSTKKRSTAGSTTLKTMIAGEVVKAMAAGVQNERRKSILEMRIPERGVYINGKDALNNCIRIPITGAIPAMCGSGQSSDVRRRRANTVVVTGVNVRLSLATSDQTRVMMFVYEPHESIRDHLDKVPLVTEPSAALGLVPEAFATQKVPFQQMGIVNKHGPLMTKKSGGDIALDSADGSPFECRLSTHPGKPMGRLVTNGKPAGSVFKKKFGGGALRRTLNWDQKGQMSGFTAWDSHVVNEYWAMGKEYTYMYEGVTDQVFERSAELFMYIDCPSLESLEFPDAEENPLVGALIKNLVVDIYFHDV